MTALTHIDGALLAWLIGGIAVVGLVAAIMDRLLDEDLRRRLR